MGAEISMGDAIKSMQAAEPDRVETCPVHGEYTSRKVIGRIWTKCPACTKAAEEKARADEQAAEKAARDARWQSRLGGSGIPPRFVDRTLPRFVADNDGQRHALQFAVNYCAEFERGHSGRCAVFIGEPGTGKTHLARIIANVADAQFYLVSGPTIVSKYVGDSEETLRMIFAAAQSDKRAIIFFDEIDSIASSRETDTNGVGKRLVAQLLTLMDGFESKGNVVVVAATNRIEDVDPALLRPGLTVVVSPLIALMQDQVATLSELGVPAAFLNSTQTFEESMRIERQVRE